MALRLENVEIALEERPLVRDLNLEIAAGEILTLMGPSGSGKSSLLSFIAGDLEPPFLARGNVVLDGARLDGLPPEARGIGRLFQDDLLFPHLTVGENLLFGMPRGPRAGRWSAMLAGLRQIDMEDFADRPPHTLSGGQRSRVALMRALLARPRAMLLDEPFNKLDAELRAAMRSLVYGHLAERRIPCLLVTHDRDDAPDGGRVLRLDRSGAVRND
jgi:putative thiamine transport system ATP-binding protein